MELQRRLRCILLLSSYLSQELFLESFSSFSLSFLSQAQLIAQSIGQSFSVAYQEFLRANGIDPEDLSQREYSDLLNTQDMYNDDLIHFSKSENCRDVSGTVNLYTYFYYNPQLLTSDQVLLLHPGCHGRKTQENAASSIRDFP